MIVTKEDYINSLKELGHVVYYNGQRISPTMEKLKKRIPITPNEGETLLEIITNMEEWRNRALKADPNFADIYARLALLYKRKGDSQKYEDFLNKALEIDPGNELALILKAGNAGLFAVLKGLAFF
jgi:tetratricopeptide (TPR) repeat protein